MQIADCNRLAPPREIADRCLRHGLCAGFSPSSCSNAAYNSAASAGRPLKARSPGDISTGMRSMSLSGPSICVAAW